MDREMMYIIFGPIQSSKVTIRPGSCHLDRPFLTVWRIQKSDHVKIREPEHGRGWDRCRVRQLSGAKHSGH